MFRLGLVNEENKTLLTLYIPTNDRCDLNNFFLVLVIPSPDFHFIKTIRNGHTFLDITKVLKNKSN